MDFAVSCPLVRYGRLLFGFCPSTRTFVPCFLWTSPRGNSPCIITRPSPPSGRPEDFHLQVTEHAQHTTKPLARRPYRVLEMSPICRFKTREGCGTNRLAYDKAVLSQVFLRSMSISNCSFAKTRSWQGFPSENRLKSHRASRDRRER